MTKKKHIEETEIQAPHAAEEKIRALIVIPVFNNHESIRNVAMDALETGLDVLVVNDGSTDNSMRKIEDLPLGKIEFDTNRGKGAAIKAAAAFAHKNHYTHIITIDGDAQHAPADVKHFIELLEKHPQSVVIGVRKFPKDGVPFSSRFGRKFSNFWIKVSCGEHVRDSQSGFRAYPVDLFRKVKTVGERFDFEIEIITRAAWAGMTIRTVDISVNYSKESMIGSKFHPFHDNLRISWMFTKLVNRNLWPYPFKRHYNKRADIFGGKKPSFKHLHENMKNIIKENFSLRNFFGQVKKLLKERSSPAELANASLVGMLFGTLPLIGMHVIAVIFYATRFKLNRLVAYNINHLCAPPFVPFFAIEIGYYIRKGSFLTFEKINVETIVYQIHQRIIDYFIGATVLAPILAALIWIIVYALVVSYKKLFPRREVKHLD